MCCSATRAPPACSESTPPAPPSRSCSPWTWATAAKASCRTPPRRSPPRSPACPASSWPACRVNFACLSGQLPSQELFRQAEDVLAEIAELCAAEPVLSLGGTCVVQHLDGYAPRFATEVRSGGGPIYGHDFVSGCGITGLRRTDPVLTAAVLECYRKPPAPEGPGGLDAFGHVPDVDLPDGGRLVRHGRPRAARHGAGRPAAAPARRVHRRGHERRQHAHHAGAVCAPATRSASPSTTTRSCAPSPRRTSPWSASTAARPRPAARPLPLTTTSRRGSHDHARRRTLRRAATAAGGPQPGRRGAHPRSGSGRARRDRRHVPLRQGARRARGPRRDRGPRDHRRAHPGERRSRRRSRPCRARSRSAAATRSSTCRSTASTRTSPPTAAPRWCARPTAPSARASSRTSTRPRASSRASTTSPPPRRWCPRSVS